MPPKAKRPDPDGPQSTIAGRGAKQYRDLHAEPSGMPDKLGALMYLHNQIR
jgi:hypothetical protein